ncbi:MAG: pyruvate dehydrogenase (acetyl-transferring), homodimeric type, partial [Rhodocyclaceae bacterium]
YSVHGLPMLPVYIYYSMFGFQRVGDLIWAASDQRARGFLIGATAGRTTLSGEGLQHEDGASHALAATNPNCRAYDPAFAYEVAVIVDYGARQMMTEQLDVFYYLTVMNENSPQPSLPPGAESGIIKGMYRCGGHKAAGGGVCLLGSGAILREVIAAGELLAQDWQVGSEIWSVTSFTELAREARETERWNRLHPRQPSRMSYVEACLSGDRPIIAATDYVCAYPQLIAAYVPARFVALGTDGFGRSDTRAMMRRFFEVDRYQVAVAALHSLVREGRIDAQIVAEAITRYGIDAEAPPPWTV